VSGRFRRAPSPSTWFPVVAAVAVLLLALIPTVATFATERLWYIDLGYLGVFWKRIEARLIAAVAAAIPVFVFVLANLLATRGPVRRQEHSDDIIDLHKRPGRHSLSRFALAVGAITAVLTGFAASAAWMEVQQFIHATPFGVSDPIFGRDVGFYVFQLPLIRVVYSAGMAMIVLVALGVGFIYLASGALVRARPQAQVVFGSGFERPRHRLGFSLEPADPGAKLHISILVALGFLWRAFGYVLSMYGLVYSPRGVVFGASYADVHGTLPGLRVMAAHAVIAAALVVVTAARRRFSYRPLVAVLAVMAVGSLIAGEVYPGLVQKLYVEPNELAAESRFIQYNLDSTRRAYALDRIEEREFPLANVLRPEDLAANQTTVQNVRLWDWEPLLDTYGQLQEMRLYYKFSDVDIDRYLVGGRYRQVMIAAREMDVDRLPTQAQTWINRHLKYTHGYGVVASPVNEVGSDGFPVLMVRDIPPKGPAELGIDRPEIYFGERTRDYVIVNTRTEEFDYPLGDENAYTRYQGRTGIELSSFLRKAAFAVRFGTVKVLLSADITRESKVLFARQIGERVRRLAPFLRYDRDPYIIIADGRLMWVQDAYTVSSAYPFSERDSSGVNYIRNSVKVVIDAYTGEVTFYVIDPEDPLAATYSAIFPGLFTPGTEMPDAVRAHLRYPEDLFVVQARMFSLYHMKNPSVFYNKEDHWNFPREVYKGAQQPVSPYYVNMVLPGEEDLSFVLFMPFTPARKDNMVAWMAAKCDEADYGKMVVYKFSKQRIVYGPMQLEAQIDQDSEISKLLSLWNQQGSRVIRGNLLVYPIGQSLLYVESIFLAAERSQLPQLKRVIVSDGTRMYMGDDLSSALAAMAGGQRAGLAATPAPAGAAPGTPPAPGIPAGESPEELARRALSLYERARERLREADWAGFGQAHEELEMVLRRLAGRE
jgi:uncharacterized membrane protein (UPF0182 family)